MSPQAIEMAGHYDLPQWRPLHILLTDPSGRTQSEKSFFQSARNGNPPRWGEQLKIAGIQ
jgi:hypothetical protein